MSEAPFSDTTDRRAREFGFFARLRRGIVLSIAATVAWLSLTLLFVAFWAHEFSLFQSVIVVVVSLLLLGGALLGAWVSIGLRWVGPGSD